LLIPAFLIAHPLLTVPGIPIGNGDLPYLEISLFPDKKLWTWNQYGSYHGLEVLPRYPIIWLFNWIDLPPDITSKFLIIGLFAIASFSFYFSSLRLFRTKLDIQDFKFRIMTVVGSLFYAYNVWSFHRIGHWYFWLGYAVLPLFFISVIYAFRYPRKWKYVIASAFLWSIASSTPHMTIFFGIVFALISIKFLLGTARKKNSKILYQAARPIALILVVYVSVNLYWIYPYLVSSQSENFQWSAAITEETTQELSRESSFPNVIRLLEGTFNMGQIQVSPTSSSNFYSVWLLASFVVPVVSFLALIWWRKNLISYGIFFSLATVLGILLTMGTNTPFNLYSYLLFYTPLFSSLQILFREPDKWGFLVAFGFSFLIVISGFSILSKLEHLRHKTIISTCFVALLLSSIAIYFYPAYRDSTESLYRPVVIPKEFKDLDNMWEFVGAEKTFVMPYAPYNTTWGKDKGTLDLYPLSAPVPNLYPSDYNNVEKYQKYLLDSIVRNNTNRIQEMIHPLGTSYIIYHNDSLMPLNKELLDGIKHSSDEVKPDKKAGLFKIFDIGKMKNNTGQADILQHNALIVGGLDRFASLSFVPYFSTANSSLIFLDQQIKNEISIPPIEGASSVILQPNKNDFVLSFLEDKYILEPFEQTNHHEPSKVWSKAGSNDPGNAWFTPYVEDLRMQNWDFDYGKGLVITKAIGAKLSMPVYLEETDRYDIFLRFLKNQKGGIINVYLDNKLIGQINTLDERSNKFVWQEIANDKLPMNLKKGEHTITLENAAGFNAVNIFGIMPTSITARLEDNASFIANKMKNILLLEAESSFLSDSNDSSNSESSSESHYYLPEHQNNDTKNTAGSQFAKKFTRQLKIPTDKDLMYLQLIAKGVGKHNNNDYNATEQNNSSNHASPNQPFHMVNDLKIFLTNRNSSVYFSNFENKYTSSIDVLDYQNTLRNLPLAEIRQISPSPYKNFLLSSPEKDALFDQKGNLKVEVKQGNSGNWNIVSTDFIPVDNLLRSVQFNLSVSAKDVKQLHSKVVYYDSNKNETGWDFVFPGRDGTFKDTIANILGVPEDTKFWKLQVLAAPNPVKMSTYIIDKLVIAPLTTEVWRNFDDASLVSLEQNIPISGKESLRVDVKERNSNNEINPGWSILSTDFIPVNDKSYYDVSMDVSAKDVKQLHSKVVYYDANKEPILSLNNQEEVNEYVFSGTDGTFAKNYKFNPSIPLGTQYLQLQMWVSPYSGSPGSFLIDNINIGEIIPDLTLVDDNFADFEMANGSIAQTKSIPVIPGHTYNYTISIGGQYPDNLAAIANFRNSSSIIENSTKYGSNASSGSIISLSPGSRIYTNVDILKPANYTIALRASKCESCSFFRLEIENRDNGKIIKNETISLKQDNKTNFDLIEKSSYKNNKTNYASEQLKWVPMNDKIWLDQGSYEVRIYSDSKADLDSMIIHSKTGENDNNNYNDKNHISNANTVLEDDDDAKSKETLVDVFYDEASYSSTTSSQSPFSYADSTPGQDAYISEYKKFNPTKHELKIKNATRPFMMSFAESYDPLWVAYTREDESNNTNTTDSITATESDSDNKDSFKIRSIPLYSIINGFYINKTGDYTLTIEYEPQKWFVEGSIVSVVAILLSLSFLVVRKKAR
jgi:hypothetical protein